MTLQLDTIHCGDALIVLRTLPDESVNCAVTSPPYFGLRDYGVSGQIGLERTPSQYVAMLTAVFEEVRRVLRTDGTLWLNLGDSYASGKGQSGSQGAEHQEARNKNQRSLNRGYQTTGGKGQTRSVDDRAMLREEGLQPKGLIGIPWRVAFALQDAGWILRSDIIWSKGNPMPESVTDRPTKAHEYVFLLAKSPRYHYDQDAIREPFSDETLPRMLRGVSDQHKWANGADGQSQHTMSRDRANVRKHDATTHGSNGTGFQGHSGYLKADGTPLVNPLGRNKRTVWTINTVAFSDAHFATFPPKLIEPMILAGCPVGGVVLDPFMSSGTTALVARQLGRHYVGIELNPEYVAIAEKRLAQPYTLPMLFEAVQS